MRYACGMFSRSPAIPLRDHPDATSLILFGLVESDEDAWSAAQHVRLAKVGAVWPVALIAQLVAAAIVFGVSLAAKPALIAAVAVHAGVIALLSGAAFATVRSRTLREWPIHRRNAVLATCAAGLSAALLSLLWVTVELPGGPIELAGLVAIVGAISVTAITLYAVRAATLGFGIGLALMLTLLSGVGIAPVVAIAAFAGFAAVAYRMARIDYALALDHADQSSEGRLAMKLMAEFENYGPGWFWEADRRGRITYISPKMAHALPPPSDPEEGCDPSSGLVGCILTDLFRMDSEAPGTERTLAFHLSSRTSFSDYSVCAAADPAPERWWSMSGRPVIDEIGRFQGFIGTGFDLTEKRKADAEINRLALFDGLTGLANRQRMRLSLDKTLAQQAGPYRPTALFLMDLDRFKAVNDTLGHQAGDLLLKQVAQRLTRVVGDAGLVGRLGGDEFQVVLPGVDNRDTLSTLSRELILALSQPYFISGASVSIGCSIGIAITPQHGKDSETLIRNADLALYAAKADGRGVHRFYSDDMLAGAKSRKQLEDDLRIAVTEGAFHLCYQPVVSTKSTRIVGYEALIRWNHPTRGPVSPADFIPIAEECGLIEAIGTWVLRTACNAAARWPADVRVAVNVSPIQFANPALPALVTSALAQSGLPANRLELEITEGVFLDESASSDQMFKALKGIGVRLALDDFGTGYSSLGYLRTAPFDKIKIDQSFVKGAAEPGNRNAAIIKAIVMLADTLGMETTAEGVELQDEIALVRDLGCSHIQGYVYGRPVLNEVVMEQLSTAAGVATAAGFKTSRAPRVRMLRSARLLVEDTLVDVRVRDISTSGAMVEGLMVRGDPTGAGVSIELVDGQMIGAQIRWLRDGRAGLAFDHPVDIERLGPPPLVRGMRRAG